MKLIIHHTSIFGDTPQFGKINEFHKRKRFPMSSLGFYCGYNYVIERDGTITQARREDERGAHTYGYNNDIAICMAGDFRKQSPTPRQLQSITALSREIVERNHITYNNIVEHRDLRATLCPVWDFKGYVIGALQDSGARIGNPRERGSIILLNALRRRLKRQYGIARHAARRGIDRLLRK